MSRDEIRKLLSGYATGSLDQAERRALFEAALDDQELFDALAKEEALRDVLEDPSVRQQLIAALSPAREPFAARAWRWVRQPAGLALAGGLAVLVLGTATVVVMRRAMPPHQKTLMAEATAQKVTPPSSAPATPAVPPSPAAQPPAIRSTPAARETASPPKLFQPPAPQAELSPALPAPPAVPPQQSLAAPPLPAQKAAPGPIAEGAARPLYAPRPSDAATHPGGALLRGFGGRLPSPPASAEHAKAARAPAAGGALNPSLAYTLRLKNPGGTSDPVPPGAVFHTGDEVRLRVESSEAGVVYLLRREFNGTWSLVEDQSVQKAQPFELPAGGLQADVPLRMELALVYSREEQHLDPDALLANAGSHSLKITLEFR